MYMYMHVYYSHKIKNIQRKFKKIIIVKVVSIKNLLKNQKISITL